MKIIKKIIEFILSILREMLKDQNKNHKNNNTTKPTYYLKKSILTKNEQQFYNTLKKVLSNTPYEIYPKIRLIDVVGAKAQDRPKLMQKHVDFLICNSNYPTLAIELDDSSHNSKIQSKRDKEKNLAFETAGLKFIRIQSKSSYDVTEITSMLSGKKQTGNNEQDKTSSTQNAEIT